MKKEKFSVMNQNKAVRGELHVPSGNQGDMPLIIFAHDIDSTKKIGDPYCNYFTKKGYAWIGFDFCGGGTLSSSDGRLSDMTIRSEVMDLERVMDAARSEHGFHPKKTILLGFGQGAVVSAITAARNPEMVSGIIMVNPDLRAMEVIRRFIPDRESLWMVKESFLIWGDVMIGRAYIEEMWDYDLAQDIKKVTCPILVIHGSGIGPEHRASYIKNAAADCETKMVVYEKKNRRSKKAAIAAEVMEEFITRRILN